MSCKPTYKGKRYNSLEELYSANGVNQIGQGSTEAPSLYDEYVSEYGPYEGIKRYANKVLGLPEDSGLDQRNDYTLKVNQILENRKNARAVDVLVSAIERAMPGVRVHRETNQSMREKGQDPNQSGFVDSDGYHLNLDRITTRTPIHELSHVFMAIIKVENKKLYDRMMQQLDDMIQDSPVFEAMRKKYPTKSLEQLKDEYMAQLAGFYSEKHIQAFIEAQNLHVHSTATENEYASTRGLFRTIWDNIRKLMNSIMGWDIERDNMENMSIQHIFETLTVKAMSGQPIPYMNGDKMEIIKDAFYDIQANFSDDNIDDDIYLNMEQQKEVKFVRSVKDIPHILINNSDPGAFSGSAEYWEGNKDTFADNIMRRLYQPTGSNKIYVEWMGKRYEFEAGSTEDTLRNRITEEVLRDHVKRITSIPSSVMKTVERYYGNPVGDESIETIIKEEFSDGQDRMTVQIPEIIRLMNLIGAEDNVVAVMSLSDFMNSEYSSEFRMLDTSIIGNNPIVVVHEATPGTIDISISDINTGDLSFNGVYTNNQKKLGARFMQDYQNPITQNAWTNSKMDTQAAALVTTIAGLRHIAQKAGVRINIRRAGVYGVRGGSSGAINAKAIYDFKDAFMQVRSVMQMDGMQALLQSNFLKDVIADDSAWDAESLDTNVLHQLESFYTNEKIYDNLSQGMIGYMVGTKGTKLEQEDAIRRRMNYLINHRTAGDVHSGAEYQLLAKAYLYVKRGWTMGTMNFDDMTNVGKMILNGHNIGNSLAQYAILEMETAKSMVVSKADAFGKEFNEHVELIRKARSITDTDPKKIFGRLHPEVEVIVDRKYEKTSEHGELNEGDRIKIRLNNELYSNSYPDKELIQHMLNSKQITKEELDFADFLLEKIREIYVDDMYTRGRAHNMDYTLEMAEDEFDKNYTPGTIPVLPATNMELFRMGHMKTWMDNMLTLMSRGDLQYGDMSTKDFGDITSRFRMQLHSSAQLDAMGLRKVTDPVTGVTEYRSIDLDKAFLQSKNLEYTLKFFQMDMTRIKIFNKYIVPLKHDIYAIAAMVKSGTGNGLEGTLSWFNEYYKLIVDRQHKDHNSKNKFEAIASPVVRSVVQLNTFINIGFRPVIWLKSAYFNEQSSLIASLANTAANMGSVTEKWNFPTVKETLKAHKLIFTDLKKVWRLAEKFQLINGTERDVLQNIAKISTDKHMFRQQIAHLGNHYGDAAARTMSMIAFLIHDGTYDAYEYNEKTDEVTYDAKKDRRLFNEDGTYKEGMDAVHKAIMLEQERQGLYAGKQEIGYDFEEINNRMKWYSDKFIIGSMDNHQKTLFGNQYLGAAMGQFRTFMWDKLWNFGWGRITTEYGGSFVPVKNEKGEYIAVRQQQEIAGMINSFGQTFKHLKKVLNQDASFWVDMAPVDRRNMADFGIRAMLLGLMVSLFALATDDDDDEETRKEKQRFIAEIMRRDPNMSRDEALERWRKHKGYALSATDRQKLEFLWQDIFVWDTVTNFYDNPIPALRVISDIYELAVGRDRLKRIVRYVGPANDAVWLYSLFTKHDDPFKGDLSNNERKKLQEERELEKEYKEMQDRLSSADIDWSKYTEF